MMIAGRELTERDWIALAGVIMLIIALIGSGFWLELRAKALRDAKAREAAAVVAPVGPQRAPPITTSIYVRAVPVRHAQ